VGVVETLVVVVVALTLAGIVTGLTGAGFAVLGTTGLALVFDPSRAVAVMLVPILAINVQLTRELDRDSLRSCTRRFGPFVAAVLVGTLAGMTLLTRLPTDALRTGIGLVVLVYVLVTQETLRLPGVAAARDRCLSVGRAGRLGFGVASGVVFGATNVGVQVVAYLESQNLDRTIFVGVLSGIFLGISAVRIVAAAVLGLLPDLGAAGLSLAAAIPGLAGGALGRRLRPRVPERDRSRIVLGLLTLVGLRLAFQGVGF
jgi:Sulfite exporter TauE/SafE.